MSGRKLGAAACLRAGLSAGALVWAAFGVQVALAQDTAAPDAGNAPAVQQPAAGQDVTEDNGDIVVTAQRREERLQNVPITMTAFNDEQLERMNITTSDQLSKITPGFVFNRSTFYPQLQIRGVGTRGLGLGEESTVPVFIDGIYQPYLTNGVFQLSDVDRIEVLKGPQSALFGRNATGGAMNVVTKNPGNGFALDVGAQYARFNELQLNGYAAVGNETLGASVAAAYYHSDGYFHDIVSNSTTGTLRTFNVRGKIVWNPSAGVHFTLSGAYVNNDDEFSSLGTPINGNTAAKRVTPLVPIATQPYTVAYGHPIPFGVVARNVALSGSFDLGFADLHTINSYFRQNQSYAHNNQSGTSAPLSDLGYTTQNESYYNEVYLTSKGTGPVDWILGGVYYKDTEFYLTYNVLSVNVTTSVATLTTSNNRLDTDSYAGYAQATWHLSDQFALIAGGRYTDETRDFHVINYQSGAVSPRPAGQYREGVAHFARFTPTASIQYQPNPDLNIYAKFGRAFKSGIFSTGGNNIVPTQPESIDQYELGLKSHPARWLRANLSAYYSDYSGLQVATRDAVTGVPVTQNAASVSIYGAEAELFIQPTRQLNFLLGLSWLDGKYDSFPNSQVTIPATTIDPASAPCVQGTGTLIGGNRTAFCDVSGNEIIKSPSFTFNLGGDYSWDMFGGTVTASGNVQYQSHFFWDTLNRIREPRRALVDAKLQWKSPDERYTIGVFGRNLTNRYYNFSIVSGALVELSQPGRPRTFGIEARIKLN